MRDEGFVRWCKKWLAHANLRDDFTKARILGVYIIWNTEIKWCMGRDFSRMKWLWPYSGITGGRVIMWYGAMLWTGVCVAGFRKHFLGSTGLSKAFRKFAQLNGLFLRTVRSLVRMGRSKSQWMRRSISQGFVPVQIAKGVIRFPGIREAQLWNGLDVCS
ncbi:uncharacterized protein LOC114754788 [Neltuma alba]|uniref:uncharacterized protein LOC114754788 n=1 Tax=Neltuma alba TaxID=207710 RepID=UPI0010A45F10|nr:uncharacterized protein LOC114754788 [Prosopis alba]